MKGQRLILSLFVFAWCAFVHAQPAGSIDPSFSVGSGPDGVVRALRPLPDNKILVAGGFNRWDGTAGGGLVRLNPDGSLDTGFQPLNADSYGVWLQGDGKILVSVLATVEGNVGRRLLRLDSNGNVEDGFLFEASGEIKDVACLSDGRLAIGGAFKNGDKIAPGIAILKADGTVDEAFTPEAGISGIGGSVVELSDGKLLVAGLSDFGKSILGLLRFLPSGVVDKTFYLDTASTFATAIFPVANGNFVLQNTFYPSRILANDSRDTHYTNITSPSWPTIRALDSAERHLVADFSLDENGTRRYFVRLFADGRVDPSFKSTVTGSPSLAAVRPDGKIITVITSTWTRSSEIACLFANDKTAPTEALWHAADLDAAHNGPVTVKVVRQGNLDASSSVDWRANFDTNAVQLSVASGTVQFESGQSVADVTFNVSSASAVTTDIALKLENAQALAINTNDTVRLHILDQTSSIELAASNFSMDERIGATGFGVTRTGGLNRCATVGWRLVGNSDPEKDFDVGSGQISFAAGQSMAKIFVRTTDDVFAEGDRSYTLELFSINPDWTIVGTTNAAVTVVDEDLPGRPATGTDGPITDVIRTIDGGAIIKGRFLTVSGRPATNLAKITKTGDLDSTFSLPRLESIFGSMFELPGGGVLVKGSVTLADGERLTNMVRLNARGEVDRAFKCDINLFPDSVALAADGSFLMGPLPSSFDGSRAVTNLGVVVRLSPTGIMDRNFATWTYTAGTVGLTASTNGQFYAYGSLVVFSNAFVSSKPPPAVERSGIIRFNADGTVDPSFEVTMSTTNTSFQTGVAGIPVPAQPATRVIALSDGSILAGGSFSNMNSQAVGGLVRLSSAGELDLKFASNVVTALGSSARITAFDALPDGKVVLLKTENRIPLTAQTILRLNADGSLDNSAPPATFEAFGPLMRVYSDGVVLVAGSFTSMAGKPRFRIAWFEPDGTLRETASIVVSNIKRAASTTQLTVDSIIAGQFRLEHTTDFVSWAPVATNTIVSGAQSITVEDDSEHAFYRLAK